MVRADSERRIFWAILLAAVIARLLAFNIYSAHHPDELIQYLEQAHRIVFGYGVVPWEFRYFIRSWLIPLMLVPPMQVGEWLEPGGTLYLALPRLMVAAINFGSVIAAWKIGRRISLQHGIVAMLVMALWFESIEFSVQTLSESMAVSLFMIAVALLKPEAKFRKIALAGALIALAGIMRFQYGPAMALFAALVAGRDARVWKGLFAGGLPMLAAGGVLDLVMGLWPYEWIYNNYAMNIAAGKMQAIAGQGDPRRYFLFILMQWNAAAALILILAVVGWRRYPALAICAVANLVLHQLIDHKEYRYIWLTIDIVLLLAAFGSVDLLRSSLFGRKIANPNGANTTTILVAGWLLLSGILGWQAVQRGAFRIENDSARLAAKALQSPAICGIAVPRFPYWRYGYALLHVNKPIFLLPDDETPSRSAPGKTAAGFNAMILYPSDAPPPAPWRQLGCTGQGRERSCLFVRPGACSMTPEAREVEYQQTLYRRDM